MKIKILEDRCKGCGLCIEFCPKKILALSDKRNLLGYKIVCWKSPENCNHCGICYLMCPEVVFVEDGEIER
ncbi:MAG: 4Fe-4S binding protein [Caldimicrobium sp.]|nr:4Fe-4S binding protein [Caldimicrobium sp.]MCX7614072.1 4Fe-4S binding protein [Caldimicrobium sp.]MDW8182849.1 4Fe-4S binding protein [Caldimicrobium sp.]